MWKRLLIEVVIFGLRRLANYADNQINQRTVKDVENRLGKGENLK